MPAHDQPEPDLPDRPGFIARAHALGLSTVIVAWQEEYGQVPDTTGVIYDHLAHFTLLAYHRPSGSILRCRQQGGTAARRIAVEELRAEGFTVEERGRNQVKFTT
jgi:hypothetical protein